MKTYLKLLFLFILCNTGEQVLAQQEESVIFDIRTLPPKDTLLITAYIADCGEFGGHKEYIRVFQNSGKIFASLIKDKPCNHSYQLPDTLTHVQFLGHIVNESRDKKELTSRDESAIQHFLTEFTKKKAARNTIISNAPTEFWIESPGKISGYLDQSGRWDGFNILRDSIFK